MTAKTKPIEGKVIEQKNVQIQEKELVPQNQSAEALIEKAINKNVPVETMERLLAMRRELKAEYAKEQYDKAMAEFQADCPEIKKTKEIKTNTGQVAYRYAPIEVIVKQVKPILQKHGFSYSIQTITGEGKVKSICIVKHIAGHSENYGMEVPLGNKTNVMSNSQVVAAASTFSKRYAFCNAFGILTGDEDDDGRSTDNAGNQTKQTIRPRMPVKQQTTNQKTTAKREHCSRCWSKFNKKTYIQKVEAEYSLKAYGFKLCRNCQGAAKTMAEARDKTREDVKFIPVDAETARYLNDVVLPMPETERSPIQKEILNDCNNGTFKGRAYYGLDGKGVAV